MRLADASKSRRAIGLTPLIDVVFLLLVFFMLASTFLKFGTVKLETAGASSSPANASDVILIHVAGGGQLRVDGLLLEPMAVENAVGQRVTDGAKTVLLIARDTATTADLFGALRLLRRTAISTVRVID